MTEAERQQKINKRLDYYYANLEAEREKSRLRYALNLNGYRDRQKARQKGYREAAKANRTAASK